MRLPMMKSLFVFVIIGVVIIPVYAQTYVNDPNNCPTTFQSQTCAVSGEVMCGFNNNNVLCIDPALITAPDFPTTSTTDITNQFDGGYLIDCESHDGTAPILCDNGGDFLCDRNSAFQNSPVFRKTVCTANVFGQSTVGTCLDSSFNCFGDTNCESTSSSVCEGGVNSNNHYTTATCIDASGGGTCACNTNAFACDGSIIDADGCEFVEGSSCGSNTGVIDSNSGAQCLSTTAANCISNNTLDCDNDDSDSTTSTCNGANGCEITIGASCTTSSGLPGTYASTCSGGAGVCLPDTSNFETGTETSFFSTNSLLWGVQFGTGLLLNVTNAFTGLSFIVDNNDNVGIGIETSSTASSALHVNSNAANTTPILTIENTAGNVQLFRTDATPESSVTGSVGDIAIDSTSGMIYIKESGTSTNTGWSEIGGSASATSIIDANSDTQVQVEESADEDKIRFDTAGAERMIIDNTGNVGIGTSTPLEELHVSGDSFISGFVNATSLEIDQTGSSLAVNVTNTGTGDSFRVNDATADTSPFLIDELGNLFLGAITETLSNVGFTMDGNDAFIAGLLGVEGNIHTDGSFISGASTTYGDGSITQSTGGSLDVVLGGAVGDDFIVDTDTLVVESDNNRVGIGTSTPNEKLTMVGGTFLQNSTNPVWAGSLFDSDNMDGAQDVYVSGKYAYIAGFALDSLAIVDVSNPSSPTLVGSLLDSDNMNGARGVYVSGKYAYVTGFASDSLAIVDVSNPSSPTLAGSLLDSTNMDVAQDVYVSGKYAYVTGFASDSLAIVDVSNPSSPTLAGSLLDSANMNAARGVYVSGKYAYVTGVDSDSLAIVDVSNPSSPTLAGSLIDSVNMKGAEGIYVSGKYAYVTGFASDSLAIVDVSNPSSPTLAGSLIDSANMKGAEGIYVSGKYAYIAGLRLDSLAIVDITGIDAPTASIGNVEAGYLSVTENAVIGNDMYSMGLNVGQHGIFSDGDVGINGDLIVDTDTLVVESDNNRVGIGTTTPNEKLTMVGGTFLQNSTNPVLAGSLIDSANMKAAHGVYVSGKYAYVTGFFDFLAIVDVSNPSSPTLEGSMSNSAMSAAHGVYVSGKYAYVTGFFSDSLAIVDVSNPSSLTLTGSLTDGAMDGAQGVYVSGKYAYVTGSASDSLAIVDVSNPSIPTLAGSLTDGAMDGAQDVYVSGKYAYVTGSASDSLAIVDVSNPSSPTLEGSLTDGAMSAAHGVYVSGKYAYVTGSTSDSLAIVDVSNPSSPTLAGSLTDGAMSAAHGVYVSGKYAYVTGSTSDSLAIVDVSNPSSPTLAGSLTDGAMDGAQDVYVSGKYAYVTGSTSDSLAIVDITGIDAPTASIGNVEAGYLSVTENAVIGNDMYSMGLNVGQHGIFSDGDVGINGDLIVDTNTLFVNSTNNNVGIGDAAPDDKLDVVGDLDVTSGCIQINDGTALHGTCASDARLKENIQYFEGGSLDLISQLKPASFEWREDMFDISGSKGQSVGFIAQDIEKVLPHLVLEKDGFKYILLNNEIEMHLIQAIKELKTENDALKELICLDHPEADVCNKLRQHKFSKSD